MRQLSFNMPNTIAFSQLVLIKKINKIVQIFPLYFLDRVLDPRGIETPHIIGPSLVTNESCLMRSTTAFEFNIFVEKKILNTFSTYNLFILGARDQKIPLPSI